MGEREIHSDSKVCLLELIGFKKSQHWLPWCSDTKESACKVGDLGLILWLGRSPGEGNGNPLQYSCLENSARTQPATFHGVVKSRTPLSDWHTFNIEWYHGDESIPSLNSYWTFFILELQTKIAIQSYKEFSLLGDIWTCLSSIICFTIWGKKYDHTPIIFFSQLIMQFSTCLYSFWFSSILKFV